MDSNTGVILSDCPERGIMKRKWQLIIAMLLALVVTGGLYASNYLTATATMDVTVAGEAIATAAPSATQPDWNSILTPPISLLGEVPAGDLFDITPNGQYSGDLAVKVCLTNTGDLVKAYDYLNMKLYLEGSAEAGETPNYQLLTLQNGEATFNMPDIVSVSGTWTQTSQSDFQGGTLNQVDTTTSPGNVILDTFSDSVTDSFNDETKIAAKTNLVVSGGQVKLTLAVAAGTKTLRPNANGDLTQFEDLIGAPTHWEAVDEEVADDAATYVGSDVAGRTDLFQLTDSGLPTGTVINSVTVYERVRREGWFDDDWRIIIKSGTTSAYSSTFAETTTWVYRSYQWTTDPNTGQPWTVAAVNALQAGAYVVTGVDVSQVYVEVNYSAYNSPGTLTSVNLLSGETVVSIDSFGYNASAIPSGTGLKVQFSQDNTTWYNSAGTAGGWDTLSPGTHSINLSGLGWSGANFYYKMEFTSNGTATPVLDEITVNFSTYYASGDLTSSAYDSGYDTTDWGTISFTINEPSGTNIQFQIRTAATEGGLSSATWYGPTGTGDYYTTSGININSIHDGDRWIQYKAYFSGPGGSTPTLSDISITHSAELVSYTVEVTGGSYCLVSTDTSEWEAGWTVTPEFYCLIMQR